LKSDCPAPIAACTAAQDLPAVREMYWPGYSLSQPILLLHDPYGEGPARARKAYGTPEASAPHRLQRQRASCSRCGTRSCGRPPPGSSAFFEVPHGCDPPCPGRASHQHQEPALEAGLRAVRGPTLLTGNCCLAQYVSSSQRGNLHEGEGLLGCWQAA